MNCAHVWPDELDLDAECLQGCGLPYPEWSEPDVGDTSSHMTTSLASTPEEVLS